MKINSNNQIFKTLLEYFDFATSEIETLKEECEKIYSFPDKLWQDKKISMEEMDYLLYDLSEMIDFTLKIVSICPFVNLTINHDNKDIYGDYQPTFLPITRQLSEKNMKKENKKPKYGDDDEILKF